MRHFVLIWGHMLRIAHTQCMNASHWHDVIDKRHPLKMNHCCGHEMLCPHFGTHAPHFRTMTKGPDAMTQGAQTLVANGQCQELCGPIVCHWHGMAQTFAATHSWWEQASS